MWSELANAIQEGDVFVYILLGLGFVGLVFLIERYVMYQFVYHINYKKFLNNLKKMIKAEDLDRAANLCRSTSYTSLPYISLKAIEAAEVDPSTVKGIIEEESIDFLPKLEKRLGVFPILAILTLFIGILGTINSLWIAFHSIDVLDTAEKQASIGHGISDSLTYTTLGLLLCMILLVGHQFLKSMSIRLIEKLHYGVVILNNLLVPQEVAFMPVAEGVPAVGGSSDVEAFTPDAVMNEPVAQQAQTSTVESIDEGIDDDDSMEDIKDEEEII